MKPAKDYYGRIIQDTNGMIIYHGDMIQLTEEPSFSTGGRCGLKLTVIKKPCEKWWERLLRRKYYCVEDDSGVSWPLRLGDKFIKLI